MKLLKRILFDDFNGWYENSYNYTDMAADYLGFIPCLETIYNIEISEFSKVVDGLDELGYSKDDNIYLYGSEELELFLAINICDDKFHVSFYHNGDYTIPDIKKKSDNGKEDETRIGIISSTMSVLVA